MNEKFFDLKSDKQDKMINAALHLFADNGYKHASTDDIVHEAGISKGLLFHYFTNKQGLYSFLMDYSVKYLLFEYERAIGDVTDYFEYHIRIEGAKVGVLRNYPYMYGFIERSKKETDPDIRAMSKEALDRYNNALSAYKNKLKTPDLRANVSLEQINTLIRLTVDGLTAEDLAQAKPDPDRLNVRISEYIGLLNLLTQAG